MARGTEPRSVFLQVRCCNLSIYPEDQKISNAAVVCVIVVCAAKLFFFLGALSIFPCPRCRTPCTRQVESIFKSTLPVDCRLSMFPHQPLPSMMLSFFQLAFDPLRLWSGI